MDQVSIREGFYTEYYACCRKRLLGERSVSSLNVRAKPYGASTAPIARY